MYATGSDATLASIERKKVNMSWALHTEFSAVWAYTKYLNITRYAGLKADDENIN